MLSCFVAYIWTFERFAKIFATVFVLHVIMHGPRPCFLVIAQLINQSINQPIFITGSPNGSTNTNPTMK